MTIHDLLFMRDVQIRPRPVIKNMKEGYRVLYTYRIIDKNDPNKFLTEFVERTTIVETDQFNSYSEILVKDLERLIYDKIDLEYFSQSANRSYKTNLKVSPYEIELRILKYDRIHPKVIQFRQVQEPFYSIRQEAVVPVALAA